MMSLSSVHEERIKRAMAAREQAEAAGEDMEAYDRTKRREAAEAMARVSGSVVSGARKGAKVGMHAGGPALAGFFGVLGAAVGGLFGGLKED